MLPGPASTLSSSQGLRTTPLSLLLLFRGNTLQTNDPTYFKTCIYDPFFSPSCPVFRVRDMVEAAGETFGSLALLVFASFSFQA